MNPAKKVHVFKFPLDETLKNDWFRAIKKEYFTPPKDSVAARDGDDAVGYVQLHRDSDLCTSKCKVCPEHKEKSNAYSVSLVINEKTQEVLSCECHDCAASVGGCKHAVAFLLWAHRRNEEPACTSIECYWNKPRLSRVGTTIKYVTIQQLCKNKAESHESNNALLEEFLQESKKKKIENCELVKYQTDFKFNNVRHFSMHYFIMNQNVSDQKSVEKVLELMRSELTSNIIFSIEKSTRDQSKSSLWHELRYGRITASKAHEASHCRTGNGSLATAIMGARAPDVLAMKRGRTLELTVRQSVGKKKKYFKPCGLFLSKEYPMIAASPDGRCNESLIEIKCPTSEKCKMNYIKNGLIGEKYLAQVQLQMYAAGVKQNYFCVAHPDFQKSKNVDIVLVEYNEEYVNNLLNNLESFWNLNIYPLLTSITNVE